MSKGKRHPKVPLTLVPTGGVGVAELEADCLAIINIGSTNFLTK